MKILAARFKAEWVVDLWNLLPKDTVDAQSLEDFREMLPNRQRDLLVDYQTNVTRLRNSSNPKEWRGWESARKYMFDPFLLGFMHLVEDIVGDRIWG